MTIGSIVIFEGSKPVKVRPGDRSEAIRPGRRGSRSSGATPRKDKVRAIEDSTELGRFGKLDLDVDQLWGSGAAKSTLLARVPGVRHPLRRGIVRPVEGYWSSATSRVPPTTLT